MIFPPLTNQEADRLHKDPNVLEALRDSKFYVLGQREELQFDECAVNPETHVFEFYLKCGSTRVGPVSMPLNQLQITTTFQVEIGQ